MHITIKEWRSVVGHDGYQVSRLGRVRSIDRISCGRRYEGKMLKPGRMNGGHVSVAIGKDNSRTVHSLVLEAFTGPCPTGCEGRHLNGQPDDNRWENLVWDTRGDNTRDKKYHNGQAGRLKIEAVLDIKFGGDPVYAAAKKHGVSRMTVWRMRTGRAHQEVECTSV